MLFGSGFQRCQILNLELLGDRGLSIEFIVDEIELDLAKCFGFGKFALGESIVELTHEQCGSAIVHEPKRGKN